MKLYQVKDIVREHLGRLGIPTKILVLALDGGRREVEKAGNWWWARATKTFNTTASTASYPITTSGGVALNLPDFKDIRALKVKASTDTRWEPVEIGQTTLEDAEETYATDEEGTPEVGVIDNVTLVLFPTPDQAFNVKMWHWEWTANPTLNTETDDLIDRFPEALIYGSLIWAYEIYLKDMQGAAYWRALLGGNPFGSGGELVKIRRYNLKREWQDRIDLVPMQGPFARTRMRLSNRKIFIGS